MTSWSPFSFVGKILGMVSPCLQRGGGRDGGRLGQGHPDGFVSKAGLKLTMSQFLD